MPFLAVSSFQMTNGIGSPQCEDLSPRHVLLCAMHQDPQPFTMLQFIMRCSVGSFVSFLCCFVRRLVSWMPPLLKCRLKCAPFCWKQTRILIKRMDTAIGPVNEWAYNLWPNLRGTIIEIHWDSNLFVHESAEGNVCSWDSSRMAANLAV